MSQIINGGLLANNHQKLLVKKINSFKEKNPHLRNPSIVSFCNEDDPPSVKYTYVKLKKALEVGIDFLAETYNKNTPQYDLLKLLKQYNQDKNVDGIIVQLPLPEELKVIKDDLINQIKSQKDVDGLTESGRKKYLPAAVKGVMSILDDLFVGWENKKIALVGSEGEVGQPMIEALEQRRIKKVIKVDKGVGNIKNDLKVADIVISATGEVGLIKSGMVSEGVIAIDVGLGDFHSSVYKKASWYTLPKGGVGPMTVISLMENVIKSYEYGTI